MQAKHQKITSSCGGCPVSLRASKFAGMHVSSTSGLLSRTRLILVALAVALLSLVPTQTARGASYQVPATIPDNCSADVSPALLAWIATVPDNSVLTFTSGACYRIDETLEISRRNGLTFEGNGATFRAVAAPTVHRSQWHFEEGSRLSLRNVSIDGGSTQGPVFNSALQHAHGIEITGPAGVDIDGVNVTNVYGDCFYVGQGWYSKAWSSSVHVHDSACSRSGRMGVGVTASRDLLVERTSFSQIAMTVFDIEPNGAGFGVSGATFTNNQVRSVEAFDALGDGSVDSVTVSNNVFTALGTHMEMVARPGQRRTNITISGNRSDTPFSNPGSVAIDAVRVDGLTVTNNVLPLGAPNMALVDASESCAVRVSGNTFAGGVAEARIHPYSNCATTSPPVPPNPTNPAAPPSPTAPKISVPVPTGGSPGTTVVITGKNLSGAKSVSFGGVEASFVVKSDTRIVATVPKRAVSGYLRVRTGAGIALSAKVFRVAGQRAKRLRSARGGRATLVGRSRHPSSAHARTATVAIRAHGGRVVSRRTQTARARDTA
jgi:hypothetical protein